MRSLLFIFLSIAVYNPVVNAQGCVAIKGTAGVCSRPSDAKGLDLNLNNRYFRSYKHFVATKSKSTVLKMAAMSSIMLTNWILLSPERWIQDYLLLQHYPIWHLAVHPCMSITSNQAPYRFIRNRRCPNSVYRWMLDQKKSNKGNTIFTIKKVQRG